MVRRSNSQEATQFPFSIYHRDTLKCMYISSRLLDAPREQLESIK